MASTVEGHLNNHPLQVYGVPSNLDMVVMLSVALRGLNVILVL